MITTVTGYQTEDGEFFPTWEDAAEHAASKMQRDHLEKFMVDNGHGDYPLEDSHKVSSMYAMLPRDQRIDLLKLRELIEQNIKNWGKTNTTISAWELVRDIMTRNI